MSRGIPAPTLFDCVIRGLPTKFSLCFGAGCFKACHFMGSASLLCVQCAVGTTIAALVTRISRLMRVSTPSGHY